MNKPPSQQRRSDTREATVGARRMRTHGVPQDVSRSALPRRGSELRDEHRADDYRADAYDPAGARVGPVATRQPGIAGWWHGLVDDGDFVRWLPVGLVTLLAIGLAGFALSGNDEDAQAANTSTVPTVLPGVVATSIAAQPMQTVETTAPVQKTVLTRTITQGMSGDDVKALQDRLTELGYDPGPADGVYGKMTISAMWAFKKLVLEVPRDQVTDEVTPEMWERMQEPIQVAPRRPNAGSVNHVEIYLPQQVMVLFYGNTPRLITHISTGELDKDGKPAPYCEDIVRTVDRNGAPLEEPIPGEACGEAKTPGGIFKIHRMEEGYHEGVLGGMWEPVYFNYGIAIHGALNVPLHPASHGCIRIERHISEYFQTLVKKGDEVAVWNGVDEPQEVSENESLPYFDRFTPDSTVPATTVPATAAPSAAPAPATTAPAPQPTPAPATTTTAAPVTTTTAAPTTAAPTTSTTTTAESTTTVAAAAGADQSGADEG